VAWDRHESRFPDKSVAMNSKNTLVLVLRSMMIKHLPPRDILKIDSNMDSAAGR